MYRGGVLNVQGKQLQLFVSTCKNPLTNNSRIIHGMAGYI